jgi:lipoprotein-anchoring transpeptidase ErfK/SrfK
VSVSRQRLCCIGSDSGFAAGTSDDRLIRELPCSTSKFGIGQQENSNRTPLGLHCIREKIGAESPPNTVFKGRKPIGTTAEIPDARITTRILWLAGLEPGFNQGGKVDTHDRYVYIHGTGDESTIGSPDSHGCVHLRAEDLIPLFDEVESGTLVWIEE